MWEEEAPNSCKELENPQRITGTIPENSLLMIEKLHDAGEGGREEEKERRVACVRACVRCFCVCVHAISV